MSLVETKNQHPLISVAMCTYNGAEFLREQLDSIIAQSYRPLEIVIVDDNSTDETWSMLLDYQARFDEVAVYQNKKNLGYIKNFEKAISLCTGEYIALADQDDIWLPEKLATQFNQIQPVSLTYSAISFIDELGQPIHENIKSRRLSGRCHLGLLFHTCVTGHLLLVKREAVNKALPFPDAINAHDRWIPFVAAAMGGISASDHVLSLYRLHVNNVSRQKKSFSPSAIFRRITFSRHNPALEKRLIFLQSCIASGLLNEDEKDLVEQLYRLSKQLRYKLYSSKLEKLLLEHEGVLLRQYENPTKAARKLSKGKPAYVMNYYVYAVFVMPLYLCGKTIKSFFSFR